MDERDLSELSFIAHALVGSPEQFEQIAREALAQSAASMEFKQASKALATTYRLHTSASPRRPDFERMVADLEKSSKSEPELMAARALKWVLESSRSARAAAR